MLKVIDEWCLLIFHYFIFKMRFSFSSLFLLVYDILPCVFLVLANLFTVEFCLVTLHV